MTSNFKYINSLPIAIIALSAALLPMANAQSPATAGSDSMKGGKADASSMSAGGMKGMDMQAMMKDKHDKMSSMKMTGLPDVDFAMMMRMHHQGGIDMAQAELRDGKSPEMRKMARNETLVTPPANKAPTRPPTPWAAVTSSESSRRVFERQRIAK